MTLKQAYKIVLDEVSEHQALRIIEYYIYKRKGVHTTINPLNLGANKATYFVRSEMMLSAYDIASDYIIALYSRPHDCKEHVYPDKN